MKLKVYIKSNDTSSGVNIDPGVIIFINIDRVPPKDHFPKLCLLLTMRVRSRCRLNKLLTTDKGPSQ